MHADSRWVGHYRFLRQVLGSYVISRVLTTPLSSDYVWYSPPKKERRERTGSDQIVRSGFPVREPNIQLGHLFEFPDLFDGQGLGCQERNGGGRDTKKEIFTTSTRTKISVTRPSNSCTTRTSPLSVLSAAIYTHFEGWQSHNRVRPCLWSRWLKVQYSVTVTFRSISISTPISIMKFAKARNRGGTSCRSQG